MDLRVFFPLTLNTSNLHFNLFLQDHAGHFHQVWYDNPQSISLKAEYVSHYGLRGIGMWNANCLDYSGDAVAKQQTEEMWKALKPKLRQT